MQPRRASNKITRRSSDVDMTDASEATSAPLKLDFPEFFGISPDAPAELFDLVRASLKDDLVLLLRLNRKRVNLSVQAPKAQQHADETDASTPLPPGTSLPTTVFKVPDHLLSPDATALMNRCLETRTQLVNNLWRKELARIGAAQHATSMELAAAGEAAVAKLESLFDSDPVMRSFKHEFKPLPFVEQMYERSTEFATAEAARKHILAKLESQRKAAAREAKASTADIATDVLPDTKVASAMREIATNTAKQLLKDAGISVPAASGRNKPPAGKRKQAAGTRRSDSPSPAAARNPRAARKDSRKVLFQRGTSPKSTQSSRSKSPAAVLKGAHRDRKTGGRNTKH